MKKISLISLFALLTIAVNAQTVDTLTIQSKVFNETRKIKVLLPKGYGQYSPDHPNKDREYMVAYLFDSQSESFFNFYKATINYLTEMGGQYVYLHPLIVVGISSPNRQYEFTPKAQTAEGLKSFAKSGGADLLATHLQEEVMPLINSKYHVTAYNIGIGHSLGATFVSYSMLKFPQLFNAGIAISPNFHYDQEQIVHKFDSLANATTLNHKFLYIAHGYRDATEERFRPSTEKVGSLLTKKNVPGLKWQVKAMDNDNHGLTGMEGIFKGLVAFNKEFTLSDSQIADFMNDKSKSFIDQFKEYYSTASNGLA
jgi:predicted alpha/beta superfamily hydrolase